jgi:hypothetical protein
MLDAHGQAGAQESVSFSNDGNAARCRRSKRMPPPAVQAEFQAVKKAWRMTYVDSTPVIEGAEPYASSPPTYRREPILSKLAAFPRRRTMVARQGEAR